MALAPEYLGAAAIEKWGGGGATRAVRCTYSSVALAAAPGQAYEGCGVLYSDGGGGARHYGAPPQSGWVRDP